jgi:predicted site-specific integrase-resolvase
MGQQNGKEWFSTDEVAAALGKAPFTVREWCRHRRIRAKKRKSGRGNAKEWMISADELKRVQDEGLLPFQTV